MSHLSRSANEPNAPKQATASSSPRSRDAHEREPELGHLSRVPKLLGNNDMRWGIPRCGRVAWTIPPAQTALIVASRSIHSHDQVTRTCEAQNGDTQESATAQERREIVDFLVVIFI